MGAIYLLCTLHNAFYHRAIKLKCRNVCSIPVFCRYRWRHRWCDTSMSQLRCSHANERHQATKDDSGSCVPPGVRSSRSVLDVAPPVCTRTTWTPLEPRNPQVQRLSWYALVIHSHHMSKRTESSFTEYVIHVCQCGWFLQSNSVQKIHWKGRFVSILFSYIGYSHIKPH